MKIRRTFVYVFLTIVAAAPLFGQSAQPAAAPSAQTAQPASTNTTWVEDFLRRYQPSATAVVSPTSAAGGGQVLLPAGVVPVMLQDVINMMLDRNLDIQSNRYSPRSSYYSSLVFWRALQPSIRFSGTASRDSSASTTQLNGATALSQLRHNFAVNFSQALPTGTSLAVDLTMNRTSSNSAFNTYNPSYTGKITYTVGQHLLRDRGRIINMRQITQGENNEKISEINFELQVTSLVVQAQKAYWDLVFANQDLKVKQDSLELAQRTLTENQTKVEIGTMAPIEVVQTKTEVASRRGDLVTSTYSVTNTEDQIKKLISNDRDPSMFLLKFSTQEQPRMPGLVSIPTLDEAIKIALENRPEIRQAELDMKNKDIDVLYTANQRKPILDVTATYSQNGTGGTQTVRAFGGNQVSQVIPGGVFDAFGDVFTFPPSFSSHRYSGYSLGASLTIPLSNKAANADRDRAVTEKQLSQSRMNATVQQILLDVRNALTQVDVSRAKIETSQLTREYAEQQLVAEQTKFDLGTSTLRFVLEEQRNVAQTRTAELQSLVNFTKALVDMDKAMGLTLKRNNIEVEKALQPTSVASKAQPVRNGN
jgi:outer membrane protein TolC